MTRTAWPALMTAESTSSIGALTKIEVGSSRSITGGIGTPGGEGEINSPTSTETSARTPAKGERMRVFLTSTSTTAISARTNST